MPSLVRALLLTVYEGLKALGAIYVPVPPQNPGEPVLTEPPSGSPERLVPGGSVTAAERWLFDELRREMQWPT
ncbi:MULTISPECIES: DUF6059 family protein [unclassified Streptomyces]|uniref:DUF6059 family protein n=1 Tax=unclassified Streptomyces TaxID=2593676 RepID=UPI0004BE7A0D|nr:MULTISPECIES: DUF6059 family protein [unclassified Streptomyces]KOV89438.1 hypothetical protein ADL04_37805 [Streptomyces sp. NRRL B-3648]